jgi:hypothetical protein
MRDWEQVNPREQRSTSLYRRRTDRARSSARSGGRRAGVDRLKSNAVIPKERAHKADADGTKLVLQVPLPQRVWETHTCSLVRY